MMFPSTEIAVIESRLDHIEFFLAGSHLDLMLELRRHFAKAKDINKTLAKFANARAKPADWAGLHATLQAFLAIHSLASCETSTAGLLKRLRPMLTAGVVELSAIIATTINFEV
jgi:DNA mismatch repair ATPase MutS